MNKTKFLSLITGASLSLTALATNYNCVRGKSSFILNLEDNGRAALRSEFSHGSYERVKNIMPEKGFSTYSGTLLGNKSKLAKSSILMISDRMSKRAPRGEVKLDGKIFNCGMLLKNL